MESSKGDVDLFLSQSFATPTQNRYTWCNQDVGKSVIRLDAQDEKGFDTSKVKFHKKTVASKLFLQPLNSVWQFTR